MTRTNPLAIPATLGLSLMLGACGAADRLANVGQAPALSPIEDPTAAKGYKPVQMPMPPVEHASFAPNSLWRTGSRAFFKDQRARQVGDLVTVKVKVTDRAQLDNTTKRSRKNGEDFGAENFFGSESKWSKKADPSSLLKLDSDSSVREPAPSAGPNSSPPMSLPPSPRPCRTAIW